MGTEVMKVRFPDGKIRLGWYNNTSDLGSPLLVDTMNEWLQGYPKVEPAPTDEDPVAVHVSIQYGNGTHGWMLARGGHLLEYAHYITIPAGYSDEDPTLKMIQDGVPPWAEDPNEEKKADPPTAGT